MSFHTLSRQLALPIAPFGDAAAFGASVFAVSAFAASGFAAGSAAGWMTSATTLVSSRQVFRVAPDGMPNVTSVPPPSLRVFRLLTPRGGNCGRRPRATGRGLAKRIFASPFSALAVYSIRSGQSNTMRVKVGCSPARTGTAADGTAPEAGWAAAGRAAGAVGGMAGRSEEHTSELQSLMRTSYA